VERGKNAYLVVEDRQQHDAAVVGAGSLAHVDMEDRTVVSAAAVADSLDTAGSVEAVRQVNGSDLLHKELAQQIA
jgi:hypothetical protein